MKHSTPRFVTFGAFSGIFLLLAAQGCGDNATPSEPSAHTAVPTTGHTAPSSRPNPKPSTEPGLEPITDAGAAADPATCAAYQQTADEGLQLALTDAKQSCSRDVDCALRLFATECGQSAGPFAIAVERIEAFDAALANINATTCSAFVDGQCVTAEVQPEALGERQRAACVDQACVVRPALTTDECRTRGVEDARYVAYSAAVEHADTACSSNSDCKIQSPGLPCLAECGASIASKNAAAELELQATELDEALCAELAAVGCGPSGPATCSDVVVFPFGVECLDGQCSARTTAQDACEAIAEGAFGLIPTLEAAGTCAEDADCVVVDRATSCVDSCYQYVTSAAALADFAELRDLQEQDVCAALALPDNECEVPYSGFVCPPVEVAPLIPVCVDGQCRAQQ